MKRLALVTTWLLTLTACGPGPLPPPDHEQDLCPYVPDAYIDIDMSGANSEPSWADDPGCSGGGEQEAFALHFGTADGPMRGIHIGVRAPRAEVGNGYPATVQLLFEDGTSETTGSIEEAPCTVDVLVSEAVESNGPLVFQRIDGKGSCSHPAGDTSIGQFTFTGVTFYGPSEP